MESVSVKDNKILMAVVYTTNIIVLEYFSKQNCMVGQICVMNEDVVIRLLTDNR
jgi:hypothetical protein